MKRYMNEKIVSRVGAISGLASVTASWQVCHNICLALVALLSLIGITIAGMPLGFLTRYAIYFWTFAVILLIITSYFYVTRRCISLKAILFNTGLIIAGIPFQRVQQFIVFFWIIGGILVISSIVLLIKEKIRGASNEKSI